MLCGSGTYETVMKQQSDDLLLVYVEEMYLSSTVLIKKIINVQMERCSVRE